MGCGGRSRSKCQSHRGGSAAAARERPVASAPDLILAGFGDARGGWLSFLRWLRENGHETPVLVVSALDTAKTAVEALQSGAADYIVKGFDIEELRKRVGNCCSSPNWRRKRRACGASWWPMGNSGDCWRSSTRCVALLKWRPVWRAGHYGVILGESGTGKDLLVQEIHERSARAANVCSRELRGATGEFDRIGIVRVRERRVHRRRAAAQGEIRAGAGGTISSGRDRRHESTNSGESAAGAGKSQNRTAGRHSSIDVDVRVISATHRDLPAEIAAGRFREDLYYRLRVVTLELPPLRAHKEDLALLVDAFLRSLGLGTSIARMCRRKR